MKLDITAKDVIHSFWVPEFSQKQDAVPGQHNSLVITPTHLGTFPVICTELCGLGHALMRSHADVVTPAKFAAFMKNGASAGPPGLAVFQQNGCGSCHTFKPANATGDDRAGSRQPESGGGEGEPRAARRVHRGVDRRPGRVHPAGLLRRDAAHLQAADPVGSVEAARAVSEPGSEVDR